MGDIFQPSHDFFAIIHDMSHYISSILALSIIYTVLTCLTNDDGWSANLPTSSYAVEPQMVSKSSL